MEINKIVQKAWDSNSKIPFMQSKEILQLGYNLGLENAKKQKNNNPIQVVENSGDFIGTTKDLIDYANNKSKDKDDPEIKRLKLTAELNVLNTKVKVTANILNYVKTHQNFWDMLDYINDINKEYQEDLYKFKLNNGLNKKE